MVAKHNETLAAGKRDSKDVLKRRDEELRMSATSIEVQKSMLTESALMMGVKVSESPEAILHGLFCERTLACKHQCL